jgi:MFS family permease
MSGGAEDGRHSALAHRDFRLYLTGQAISQLGTKMQHAALLWHLYKLTHSPYALGAFGIARVAPLFLFGLVGGVLADRAERRRLLMRTQLMLAIPSLALGLWSYRGLSTPWPIYVVAAASATIGAFDTPARQSLLPNLVPPAELSSAINLDSLAQKASKVLGPLLMAPVIGLGGPAAVYLVNAASFVAVVVALVAMKGTTFGTPAPAKRKGGFAEVVEGLRYVMSSRVLGPLLAVDFAASFFGSADTMLPLFAAEVLHRGAGGYGLLAAAVPVGAFTGTLSLSLVGKIDDPWRRAIQAVLAYGVGIIAFGLSRSLPIAMVALAFASCADTVGSVLRNTVRHATTPDHLRGRVASLNTLLSKSGPWLGEMESGIVAGLLGVSASIAVGGAACLVSVGVVVPLVRRTAVAIAQRTPPHPVVNPVDSGTQPR